MIVPPGGSNDHLFSVKLPTGDLLEGATYDIEVEVEQFTSSGVDLYNGPFSAFCYYLASGTQASYDGTCTQVLDQFTYTPNQSAFSWQQNYSWVYNNRTGLWEYRKNMSGTFVNTSLVYGSADYTWYDGSTVIATVANPGSYSFTSCGVHQVSLEVVSNENATDNCMSVASLSIDLSDAIDCSSSGGGGGGRARLSRPA
ncbi:MAG: hypothetical protein OHK0039_18390 [Bacteroidia bacterium]